MNEVGQTIGSYNKNADFYEAEADKRGIRVKDVRKAFSYLKDKKNPVVVELGCAHGRDAQEIVKFTSNYSGMDASEKLIEKARKKLPSFKFDVATFKEYKFPKNVDIVFAFASLLHADKKTFKSVLKKANRALNTGGVFFISLQEADYKKYFKKDEMGDRMYYYYSPGDIRSMKPFSLEEVFVVQYYLRDKKWFNMILQKL